MTTEFEESKLIQYLDDNYSEIDAYRKTEESLQGILRKKQKIKDKLDICKKHTEEGIVKSQSCATELKERLEILSEKQNTAITDGESFIVQEIQPLMDTVGDLANDVEGLQKLQLYLSWIIEINKLSQGIEKQLSENSIGIAVDLYRCMNNIYDRLKSSSCSNLLRFIQESSAHWFKVLCDIILTEFKSVLNAIKWPFPSGISAPAIGQNDESMELFQRLLKFVLNIDSLHKEGSEDCLLLSKSLASPLEKRFLFHFYGKRQTNNLEKPEWFFTQTLNWIRDHSPFIENTVQLLVDRELEDTRNVKEEFIRLLVQLVVDKMRTDLPAIVRNEEVFAHWIDESLLYEKELKMSYGFSDENTNVVKLLTEDIYLERWLALEQKYFNKNVEKLLELKSAWKPKYEDLGDLNSSKAPEVVEEFMIQLSVMTERFEQIPCLDSRLKFVDLQLALCHQFIGHLKDTANIESSQPLHQCFCSIINGVQYMQDVLSDWNEKTVYVRLSYARQMMKPTMHKKALNTDKDIDEESKQEHSQQSTFRDVIETLQLFESELTSTIVVELKEKVIKHLKSYKNERWHSMRNLNELVLPVMSDSACPLVKCIRDQLNLLKELLCTNSFSAVWPLFAKELDSLLYEMVILVNHFNGGGAGQLNHDITKNVYVLFGEFTLKPHVYFKMTKEALLLLNLMPGSAVLMKDLMTSFERARGDEQIQAEKEVKRALADIGVVNVSMENCRKILNSRIDWPKA